jgi:hypothetical protein
MVFVNGGCGMEANKVVVKFKDKKMLKGTTSDFFPNKNQFHLNVMNGESLEVQVADLKAIFFVKDYAGNKDREKAYVDEIKGTGRKMQVDFSDGESVIGYTLGYSPDRQGFYLTPADAGGNNIRIFIVKSATDKIAFL